MSDHSRGDEEQPEEAGRATFVTALLFSRGDACCRTSGQDPGTGAANAHPADCPDHRTYEHRQVSLPHSRRVRLAVKTISLNFDPSYRPSVQPITFKYFSTIGTFSDMPPNTPLPAIGQQSIPCEYLSVVLLGPVFASHTNRVIIAGTALHYCTLTKICVTQTHCNQYPQVLCVCPWQKRPLLPHVEEVNESTESTAEVTTHPDGKVRSRF